jgi:uncharacterized membrane protein YdjX (TVP38/TMEM64 family)
MAGPAGQDSEKVTGGGAPSALRRWLPVAVVLVLVAGAYACGLGRYLSLDNLVRHRAAIDAFVTAHYIAALALFAGVYLAVVALSIPVSLFLTVAGGILFGVVAGAAASVIGATAGAVIVFLIARTAAGDFLVRRAGSAVEKLADGFRADAFNYLLFLRLVPLFPFWLVNLAPALFDVPLRTFVVATAIGILPGAVAFAFVGAGLDSAIGAQEAAFKACLAAGKEGCKLDFDLRDAATPELIAGLVALGLVALIPIVVRRLRARRAAKTQQEG